MLVKTAECRLEATVPGQRVKTMLMKRGLAKVTTLIVVGRSFVVNSVQILSSEQSLTYSAESAELDAEISWPLALLTNKRTRN